MDKLVGYVLYFSAVIDLGFITYIRNSSFIKNENARRIVIAALYFSVLILISVGTYFVHKG